MGNITELVGLFFSTEGNIADSELNTAGSLTNA